MTAAIATEPPRTLTTGHVGLNVSDLDRSRTFYERVFGFTTVSQSKEEGRAFAFLGDGDRLMLTLWQQSAGPYSAATPGLHHLSFRVDSIAEVRAFEERLRSSGLEPLHGGIVPHAEGRTPAGSSSRTPMASGSRSSRRAAPANTSSQRPAPRPAASFRPVRPAWPARTALHRPGVAAFQWPPPSAKDATQP